MRALNPGLDWAALLAEVRERGAVFAADVVRPEFCAALHAEVDGGPYAPVTEVVGPVRQEAESFELRMPGLAGYPLVAELCAEVVAEVHQGGVAEWSPTEVAVQRYQPGAIGITPHRDQRRFVRLIAVITIAGSAPFSLHERRDGPPVRTFDAAAGSLIVLRGPRLVAETEPDGRPMHAVGGPRGGPRTSLGLRMATHLSE